MEHITFVSADTDEEVDFFVLETTVIGGKSYLLVTDSEGDEDAECLILRDDSSREDEEAIYIIVDEDNELAAVSKVFEELLEDISIER
jgi:uncharacterized protein YrzB (UPF0473 family)